VSAIVAAVASYCKECPPGRKCLDCVFLPWAERVADHLQNRGKGEVVRLSEWKRGAARRKAT
jgi:hypothetical protein